MKECTEAIEYEALALPAADPTLLPAQDRRHPPDGGEEGRGKQNGGGMLPRAEAANAVRGAARVQLSCRRAERP